MSWGISRWETSPHAGAKGSRFIDHGSDKTIRVHCAMGSVGVLFPEES